MRKTDTYFGVSCSDVSALRTAGNGIVQGVVLKWGASSRQDNRDLVEHARGLLLITCSELLEARDMIECLRGRIAKPTREANFPELMQTAEELLGSYDCLLDAAGRLLRSAEMLSTAALQAYGSRRTLLLGTSCLTRIDSLHSEAKRLMNQFKLRHVESLLIEFAAQNIVS